MVGTDGNGNAFDLSGGKVQTFIPLGGSAATAFGINDQGTIVGQYTNGGEMPGFIRPNAQDAIRINAPSGPDIVNAQGINNEGLVVGFYVGTDGQDHGFMANERDAQDGELTGTAIADPTIPTVPGEPGATFVFSQILAVNDKGIAVGYYGDSTTSQHGFLYNTNTGQYTLPGRSQRGVQQRRRGHPDHRDQQLGRDHRVLLGRQRGLPLLRGHHRDDVKGGRPWMRRERGGRATRHVRRGTPGTGSGDSPGSWDSASGPGIRPRPARPAPAAPRPHEHDCNDHAVGRPGGRPGPSTTSRAPLRRGAVHQHL